MAATQDCFNRVNDCPCSTNPLANLTSELPDRPEFISVFNYRQFNPIGWLYGTLGCKTFCVETTQAAADLCAQQQAAECVFETWKKPLNPSGGGPPPPPSPNCITNPQSPACRTNPNYYTPVGTFTNQAQVCTVPCPDGSVYTAFVPAGLFSGLSQAAANAAALSYACRLAAIQRLCFATGELEGACLGEPYLEFLIVTGGTQGSPCDYNFSIVSGSLPPGISLNACNGDLSGTPSDSGVFSFAVRATDADGNFQTKNFDICVIEITNETELPEATVGEDYFEQMLETPGEPSQAVWTVVAGELPEGMILDTDGTLHGAPVEEGDYTFTIAVTVPCP